MELLSEQPKQDNLAMSNLAPSVASRVGELGRPSSDIPLCRDLDHLPGESGLMHGLWNIIGLQRHGNAHLLELVRRNGPIFRSALAAKPLVCIADPEVIASIARNEDRAWSAALAYRVMFGGLDVASPTLDNLVGLDFEPHREARRLMQPAFSPTALAAYLGVSVEMFDRASDKWLAAGRVPFKSAVRELFGHVASAVFMGPGDPAELASLDSALLAVWEAPLAVVKHRWLSRTWRRGVRGYTHLSETLRAQVDARRASDGTDLFSRMCQAGRSAVDWVDDDTLVRLFIGIMAGAFETTSLGAASMAYLLAKDPAWQERLREEGRAVGTGMLEYDASKRLEAHEWFWKETLRVYPVAPTFPRRTLRDVDVLGYRVPAGTFVQCLTGPALADPRWWTNPKQFDPERFSPERAEDKRHRGAFLPFGSGAHTCIGLHLANLKVKALFHTMLSKFRFRLAQNYDARHEARPFGAVSGEVELVLERL